jgi:hypothetical protein
MDSMPTSATLCFASARDHWLSASFPLWKNNRRAFPFDTVELSTLFLSLLSPKKESARTAAYKLLNNGIGDDEIHLYLALSFTRKNYPKQLQQ